MATIDTTPPIVISSSPANHATNVLVDSRIVVEFKDDIKAGSGYIVISNGQGDTRRLAIHDRSQVQIDNAPRRPLLWGWGLYEDAYHHLSIKPKENWLSNSRYYVQVDAGAITSASGTPLPGVTDTTTYSFTTHADVTAPIPLTAEYTLDSKGTSTITATFNEPIKNYGSSYPVVVTNRQGDRREMSVSTNGNQVKLSAVNLLPNTTYFLTVPPGLIRDLAHNPFAGVPDASAFAFKSGNDSLEPTIATGNSLDKTYWSPGIGENISVEFDQNVEIGTGNITLSDGQGDARTLAVNDRSQVSLEHDNEFDCFHSDSFYCDGEIGSILTINPTENLLPNRQYTVQLDPGVVANLVGKPYAGTTVPISFKTKPLITKPLKVWTPQFLSQDGGHYEIYIDFDNTILLGAGNITVSNGQGDTQTIAANDNSQVYIGTSGVSECENKVYGYYTCENYSDLHIKPSKPLLPSTSYFVLVDDGAFTNLSGFPLAGVQDPAAVTFTTKAIDPVLPPPIYNPVEEINHGSSLGRYEDKDVLVFHFTQPVKDYASFELSNGHTFGGNDLVLSPDRLSASVELTAASTVAQGDILTFAVRDAVGTERDSYYTPGEYVLFKL